MLIIFSVLEFTTDLFSYLKDGVIHLVTTINNHKYNNVINRQSIRELREILDIISNSSKCIIEFLKGFIEHGYGDHYLGFLSPWK